MNIGILLETHLLHYIQLLSDKNDLTFVVGLFVFAMSVLVISCKLP